MADGSIPGTVQKLCGSLLGTGTGERGPSPRQPEALQEWGRAGRQTQQAGSTGALTCGNDSFIC